ncbi:MAG: AraC family transcriptional regulator [Pseudomonadota bacterium]
MIVSRSSKSDADPFSEVLSALGARSVRGTSLFASGSWALSFDGRERLKFVAVVRGQCCLRLPDHPPKMLTVGDVALINNTQYTVASERDVKPTDGMALYAPAGRDNVRIGSGDETIVVGGGSGFADGGGSFVMDALPPFLLIEQSSPAAAAVRATLESLRMEVSGAQLGSALVAGRLAEILVIAAIRAFVATNPTTGIGWITALADPRIGQALRLMHGDVANRWTVPMLASEVGMSRSAFAQRFTRRVGRSPLDYLTRWRMVLARQGLNKGQSVATVSSAVGYASQSAFSHAFKREFGRSPRSTG